MFIAPLTDPSNFENLFDAWAAAAHDASVAWERWVASDARHRAGAYASYRAGLDREERAAEVLAASARGRGRRRVGALSRAPLTAR